MEKLKIDLIDYNHTCGDGCCLIYGTIVKINGEELPLHNTDTATIIEQILKHLGYNPEINIEVDCGD